MMRVSFFLSLLVFAGFTTKSQERVIQQQDSAREGRLIFQPLIANFLEPRIGITRLVNEQRLRLDIGNSVDLITILPDSAGTYILALGADFFTWSSLRQTANFHFPVDAVDYLFGMNASYAGKLHDDLTLVGRFRWSHISAHLVDGSYEKASMEWRDGRLPRVYSREFFELIAAVRYRDILRLYAGGQFLYHVDPSSLGQLGLEWGMEVTSSSFLFSWMHPYFAYDCRLVETNVFSTEHSVQAGLLCGAKRGTNLNIFLAFYQGFSQHGEYYDVRWSYWGPGFSISF
jgi:hypothetical protein